MKVNQLEADHLVQNLAIQFPDLFGALDSAKALQFSKYIQSDKAIFEEIRHANENVPRSELRVWLAEFV